MFHRPKGGTRARCLRIKCAVNAVIAGKWFHQIVRTIGILGLVRLLAVVRSAGQVAVEQAGRYFVPDDRLRGWPSGEDFAPFLVRGPVACPARNFRLEDRRRMRWCRT